MHPIKVTRKKKKGMLCVANYDVKFNFKLVDGSRMWSLSLNYWYSVSSLKLVYSNCGSWFVVEFATEMMKNIFFWKSNNKLEDIIMCTFAYDWMDGRYLVYLPLFHSPGPLEDIIN